MSKFKIGDKIKRINDSYGKLVIGDVAIIDNFPYPGSLQVVGDDFHTYSDESFELVKSTLSELPEKWYIKGSIELAEYFKEIGVIELHGSGITKGYYKTDISNWELREISILTNHIPLTVQQYKQLINKNNNNENNEIQRTPVTDRKAIGSSPIRSNSKNSRITVGTRLSLNPISSKPSRSKVKTNRITGAIFKSEHS